MRHLLWFEQKRNLKAEIKTDSHTKSFKSPWTNKVGLMKSLSTPYLCYFRSIQLNFDQNTLSSQLFLTVSVKLTFKQMIIMAVTSDFIDFYATWPVKIYYSRVKHEIIPHSINPKRYQWFGSFGDNFLPAIHDSVYYKNTLYRLILIWFY